MPAETNSKQNTIIWSVAGGVIFILCGIIGWLVNGKDTALSTSIGNLILSQNAYMEKAEKSDQKIMDAFQKLCDRVGGVEGRVGNLEIYIQMPYGEREKYFLNGTKKKNN